MQSVRRWKLQKYARIDDKQKPNERKSDTDTERSSQWQFKDGEKETLWLTLTEGHQLLVTHGSSLQESHSLWQSDQWIRGIARGNTLLLILKLKIGSHRFRMKFSQFCGRSDTEQCEKCVAVLSDYFPIKAAMDPQDSTPQMRSGEVTEAIPTGQTPLPTLAKVVSGQLKTSLPLAYQETRIPTQDLGMFIRTCLTDSNFPAFVGQVEKSLDQVMKDSPTQ